MNRIGLRSGIVSVALMGLFGPACGVPRLAPIEEADGGPEAPDGAGLDAGHGSPDAGTSPLDAGHDGGTDAGGGAMPDSGSGAMPDSGQGSCEPSWSCTAWSVCARSQETRSCTDSNSCGTDAGEPLTEQSCTCEPDWSCTAWSVCAGSQETRSCTDANSCGTDAGEPLTQQSCSCVPDWSCTAWSGCNNSQQILHRLE